MIPSLLFLAGVLVGAIAVLAVVIIHRYDQWRPPATRRELARTRQANRLLLPNAYYPARWIAAPRDDFDREPTR